MCVGLLSANVGAVELPVPTNAGLTNTRMFTLNGVVEELKSDGHTVVIRHEAVANYMAAMTMPFNVKTPTDLAEVRPGDKITFQLHVTESASWVDQIVKIGTVPIQEIKENHAPLVATKALAHLNNPLLDYKFTNELGQAVSLNDFRGQALAITFFYTRCPLPEYCPRLSKNFQEAAAKLSSMPNAPGNWHFLSVSFDSESDTPPSLKAYGDYYRYDPAHWSFLTGPPDKIAALARGSGVTYEYDHGTINHNFRTLIIDAGGHLQMVFPTSGDLSEAIVQELLKAAGKTNQVINSATSNPRSELDK